MKGTKVLIRRGDNQGKIGTISGVSSSGVTINVISAENGQTNKVTAHLLDLVMISPATEHRLYQFPETDTYFTGTVKSGEISLSQNAVKYFGLDSTHGFDFFLDQNNDAGLSVCFGISVNKAVVPRFTLKPGKKRTFVGPKAVTQLLKDKVDDKIHINFQEWTDRSVIGWLLFQVEPDAKTVWDRIESTRDKDETQEKYLEKIRRYLFR